MNGRGDQRFAPRGAGSDTSLISDKTFPGGPAASRGVLAWTVVSEPACPRDHRLHEVERFTPANVAHHMRSGDEPGSGVHNFKIGRILSLNSQLTGEPILKFEHPPPRLVCQTEARVMEAAG